MKRSRPWWMLALVAALVAGGLWWWRARSAEQTLAESPIEASVEEDEGERPSATELDDDPRSSLPLPRRASSPPPARQKRPAETDVTPHPQPRYTRPRRGWTQHTVDPCAPLPTTALPEGYEATEAQDITVAWSPEAPVREPTALAHVVAGLLEEAALLTGTARRDVLTVIVHPDAEAMRQAGGAPKWAQGVYDGAVHVAHRPTRHFELHVPTLRHELMHAHLHAAVGCAPAWFGEGVADLFEGAPTREGWVHLLRSGAIDLTQMQTGYGARIDVKRRMIFYAQSLAMVLHAVDNFGDRGLIEVVEKLQTLSDPLALWESMFPYARERDLERALALRLFGLSTGSKLDEILAGAMCCEGRIEEYACRPTTPHPRRRFWTEDAPIGMCFQALGDPVER